MNTNEKGNIGLANVILDITNKGYFSFLPFSDTTHVDLVIANKKMELKKIQIKYISIFRGVLSIATSSVVNGKRVPVDLTQTDIWAIYCPNNGIIYYVSAKELINKKTYNLRIDEPKQKQIGMHYGTSYLEIENAWN
jgi:hypothetical protein